MVLAGGLAGVLVAYLIVVSGGNWVLLAIYMTVLALITTACTFLVPETLRRDLTRLDDAVRVSRDEAV